MGYPLKLTLVYTLVKQIMELQRSAVVTEGVLYFSFSNVLAILRHTLMTGLMTESDNEISEEIAKTNLVWVPADRFADSEHLSKIFRKPLTPALLSAYFKDHSFNLLLQMIQYRLIIRPMDRFSEISEMSLYIE